MNCMKCGREIPLGQVFCKDCLADMEKFPVRPDTPVQLPTPVATPLPRRTASIRKARKPEEQIASLRKAVLWLSLSLITVLLAFAITVSVLVVHLNEQSENTLPGQNYSTVEDTSKSN